MKHATSIKLLCVAAITLSSGFGCSDEQQSDAGQTAGQTDTRTAAGQTPAAASDETADNAPSLLSASADAPSDISAIREDDSATETVADDQTDVDDETAIRNQAEQFRKTKDADTRVQILEEIGNINTDDLTAVALFTEALKDKNADVRLAAVNQLSISEANEAVDGLIGALHDSNTEVVVQAIDALSTKNDARIAGELSSLLNHKNQDIRDSASFALDSLQEE